MLNCKSLCLILLLLINNVYGNQYLDSLQLIIKNQNHDTIKAKAYHDLATYYYGKNNQVMLNYIDSGVSLAKKHHWSRIYLLNGLKGNYFQYIGNADSSLYYQRLYYLGAKKQNDLKGEAIALNNLANAFLTQSKYDSTYVYALLSIEANQKANNDIGIAIANEIVGSIEYIFGNFSLSTSYLKKSALYYNKANDKTYESICFLNIASTFITLKQWVQAETYLEKANTLVQKLNDTLLLAEYQQALANYYLETKQPELVINAGLKGIKYANIVNGNIQRSQLESYLAKAYMQLNKTDYAKAYALKSVKEAIINQRPRQIIPLAEMLATIYEKELQLESALYYYKLYKQYSDSIYNTSKSNALSGMAVKFQLGKIETEKKELALENEQKNDRLKLSAIAFIVFLSIAIIIIFLIYQNKRKVEKINLILGNQDLLNKKIFGIVSHDLKAPVANNYLVLKKLKTIATLGIAEEKLFNLLQKNNTIMLNVIDHLLHWTSKQLYGFEINKKRLRFNDILQPIFAFFEIIVLEKQLKITCDIPSDDEILADDEILSLTLRNVLSNAIKFSTSNSTIKINLIKETMERFTVLISDSGIGMTEEQLLNFNQQESVKKSTTAGTFGESGSGIGIALVKDFLTLHKATIMAKSNDNQNGVTVIVQFN